MNRPSPEERRQLRPWSRLVPIFILGRRALVPENNELLRCFGYLFPGQLAAGRFCWNHECGNSKFYYRLPGQEEEHKARACRFVVREGMRITVLSAELKHVLRELLQRPPDEVPGGGVQEPEDPPPLPVFKKDQPP